MKKILTLGLISVLTLALSTGCNSTHGDPSVSADALYVNTHDNEKILHAIKEAGKENGWEITEFKANEVIVEKSSGGDSISSSIKFQDGHIEFSNDAAASGLSDDIEKALEYSSSAH
ncbi:MAG: hypothetical protein ABFQ64_06435 [Campylobacterota bacterium]